MSTNPYRDLLEFAQRTYREELKWAAERIGEWRQARSGWHVKKEDLERSLKRSVGESYLNANSQELKMIWDKCLVDAERTGFPVGEVTNQVNIIFKACHNLLRWQENAPTGPKEKENGELARKYLREQYEGMFDAWQFIEVFATRAGAVDGEREDTKTNTKASASKRKIPPSQHYENPRAICSLLASSLTTRKLLEGMKNPKNKSKTKHEIAMGITDDDEKKAKSIEASARRYLKAVDNYRSSEPPKVFRNILANSRKGYQTGHK